MLLILSAIYVLLSKLGFFCNFSNNKVFASAFLASELELFIIFLICCSFNLSVSPLYNLTPIIRNLRKDADLLNAFFIEHQK